MARFTTAALLAALLCCSALAAPALAAGSAADLRAARRMLRAAAAPMGGSANSGRRLSQWMTDIRPNDFGGLQTPGLAPAQTADANRVAVPKVQPPPGVKVVPDAPAPAPAPQPAAEQGPPKESAFAANAPKRLRAIVFGPYGTVDEIWGARH